MMTHVILKVFLAHFVCVLHVFCMWWSRPCCCWGGGGGADVGTARKDEVQMDVLFCDGPSTKRDVMQARPPVSPVHSQQQQQIQTNHQVHTTTIELLVVLLRATTSINSSRRRRMGW